MPTQTSNTLHNVIMEAGSKDRPPMLAPGNYVQWKSIIKRYIDTKPNHELIHYCLENPPYEFGWKDKEVPTFEGSSITRTERQRFETLVKQSQELKNVSYHKLYDILKQHQHEVNEIRAKKIARVANPLALVAQQQPVYHPQNHPAHYTQNSSTRSQQATTRNRGKAIVNSPQPIYDQKPSMVAEDDETSKDNEIDKLMALISLSFKKIYKPTNKNLRTSSNTSRTNQDNSPRINRNDRYENQRIGNVVGARETVEAEKGKGCSLSQGKDAIMNWKRIICIWHNFKRFLQMLLTLDLSLMLNHCKREEIDQNDDDNDLAKERELLDSLIEKLKCEIDESKNHNKFLETSNKALIEKFKGEIKDLNNKKISLESSNKFFKEANNRLSETNNLMYADYKKSEAELGRRNSKEYASQMKLECAKVRAPDTDEVIRLEKESRSKLSDLIRPFDYDKLNNLYDLFVPQREKSSEQRYFSERSRLSHTNVYNGNSNESFHKQ
nr:hypothetical protein [Tanacetum cinerariifolium]